MNASCRLAARLIVARCEIAALRGDVVDFWSLYDQVAKEAAPQSDLQPMAVMELTEKLIEGRFKL